MDLCKEYQKLDKLCDKIHSLFIKTSLDDNELNDICNKNNIDIGDYLYWQGYASFTEYLKDIKILRGL